MPAVSSFPVDPTKFAEYPILLGDKLAGKASAKGNELINVSYNYKRKGSSPHQKAVITHGPSDDLYNLTIEDKAGDTEQTTLTYKYRGSVDPSNSGSEYGKLFLVFDSKRKAFILEPVSNSLNFNLRSAPGKTDREVSDQYPQLGTLLGGPRPSNDSRPEEDADAEETGPADESNPFDFRHFLPKEKRSENDKTVPKSPSAKGLEPDKYTTKPAPTHLTPSAGTDRKQKTKPAPRTKTKTDPLRQQKRSTKTAPAPAPAPKSEPAPIDSSPSEEESKEKDDQPGASPSSNIIVDGDLIIDMGSPPPQRPAFKINPQHFSSNNASANEEGFGSDEDEGELEGPRLPSPAMRGSFSHQRDHTEDKPENGEEEKETGQREYQPQADADAMDDDDLAAEMEAAFEQEEEQDRTNQELQWMQQQQQSQQSQRILSDDESEVSEEE